jgi:hypothetical protein
VSELPSRYNAGDRLTAEDFNRALDTIRKVEQLRGPTVQNSPGAISIGSLRSTRGLVEPAISTLARNTSENDLLPYSPCGIAGHAILGEAAKSTRVFDVRIPIEGDERFFAITAEPIRAGEVGRVYITGACLCRIKNTGEPGELRCAEIDPEGDYLLAAMEGGAQILWEDEYEDDDVHLGLVRFPRGGGNSEIAYADIVSTANRALSGTPTIDGVVSTGKRVLLVNQTMVVENGLYQVPDDGSAWTFIGQPRVCHILTGTAQGGGSWRLIAANDYDTMLSAWG